MNIGSILLTATLCCAAAKAGAQTKTGTERRMERAGLTDIQTLDASIAVSLMYGRADNFTGKRLYTDLHRAYLHPEAAKALVKAQAELKKRRPDLTLKVYDATRPMSVQQSMWDVVKNTPQEKYVSNPARGGGLHNYGLAVDVTLAKAATGDTLPMGVLLDHLGRASHIDIEDQLVQQRVISAEARANRQLLRAVMKAAGFRPLRTEWWHFNYKTREEAKRHYKVVP